MQFYFFIFKRVIGAPRWRGFLTPGGSHVLNCKCFMLTLLKEEVGDVLVEQAFLVQILGRRWDSSPLKGVQSQPQLQCAAVVVNRDLSTECTWSHLELSGADVGAVPVFPSCGVFVEILLNR